MARVVIAAVSQGPNPETTTWQSLCGFQEDDKHYISLHSLRRSDKYGIQIQKRPLTNMATEKERKLQIEPIVQESVVHNARVRSNPRRLQPSLISNPLSGPHDHPLPNFLPLWHRLRYPRPRILLRLHILLPWHPLRFAPDLASAC